MLGKPKELRKALAGKPHTLSKADVLSLLKGKYKMALFTVFSTRNTIVIEFCIEVIIVPVIFIITYAFYFISLFQKLSLSVFLFDLIYTILLIQYHRT